MDRLVDDLVAGAGLTIRDPLAEAAWQVRALATEPLPPATRERHLAHIRQALAPPLRQRRFAGFRRRVAVIAAAVTATLTFTGGATYAAAQQALPGDALYGVKRATERLALAVEQDPDEDAKLLVRFAQRRLLEAAATPGLTDELVAEAIVQLEAAAAVPGVAGSQSLEVIRQLLAGRLEGPTSQQAQHLLARVCVELARERGEEVPAICATEAQAPPPAPPGASTSAGTAEGAPGGGPPAVPPPGEPPPGAPPPGAPPPPPGAPPPGQPPPEGPPPEAAPPEGPPPEGPPPEAPRTETPEGGEVPEDVPGSPTDTRPPDRGRQPRGHGKDRAESGHWAADDIDGPSAHETDRGASARGRAR